MQDTGHVGGETISKEEARTSAGKAHGGRVP